MHWPESRRGVAALSDFTSRVGGGYAVASLIQFDPVEDPASRSTPAGGLPELQCRAIGNSTEIGVGRQHCQIVTYAQLREESVNCSDLHAASATAISQFGRVDVILAIRRYHWNGRKSFEDLIAGLRACKPLEKILKDEAGRQDNLVGLDCPDQRTDLSRWIRRVAPQRERPDAGVDEEAQSRPRPAL